MDTTSTLFMPPQSSTIASEVDALFYFIFYTAVVLFAIVVGATIFFIVRYRRRGEYTTTSGKAHNTLLEIVWTVIPTILVVIVFIGGFKGYMRMNVLPKDAIEIKATGQTWFWTFDYPEGINSVNELVIPVGKPVKLLLSSKDVVHSFYVPDFRTKMDVLPNRYTITWFEATDTGKYDLYCTEFCGTGHSEMIGKVTVVTALEYDAWVEAGSGAIEGESMRDYGARLYASKACNTCHSVDGTPGVAPSFKGLYGRIEVFADGSSLTADENYMRESILDPNAKVVQGFGPVMPTFQGILKDRDIDALIEFIKSVE